jgi:hypothetical protein
MTRFTTLLGGLFIALGLSSCSVGTDSTNQKVACYDTGSGVKCVQASLLPAGATPVCEDDDGSDDTDDDATDGTDDFAGTLHEDGGDDSDAESCVKAGDSGSESSDGMDGTSASSDTDGDGVPDGDDCDCTGTTPPPQPPPGGDTGGTPVPRVLRLGHTAHAAMSVLR